MAAISKEKDDKAWLYLIYGVLIFRYVYSILGIRCTLNQVNFLLVPLLIILIIFLMVLMSNDVTLDWHSLLFSKAEFQQGIVVCLCVDDRVLPLSQVVLSFSFSLPHTHNCGHPNSTTVYRRIKQIYCKERETYLKDSISYCFYFNFYFYFFFLSLMFYMSLLFFYCIYIYMYIYYYTN